MWSLSSKGSRPEGKPGPTQWQGTTQRPWAYQPSYLGGNVSAGIWGKGRTSQSWSKYWSRSGWGDFRQCSKRTASMCQKESLRSLGITPVSASGFLWPLALFIVMLPKAHLTSHSRMSGSKWVITPMWLSGLWRSFFVKFFCVFLPPLLNIFCFC